MIAGGIFCFIGLFLVIPIFGFFGVILTIFAVIITFSNGYTYFKGKNIMGRDIIVYDEGLITKYEYDKKCKEIIDKI